MPLPMIRRFRWIAGLAVVTALIAGCKSASTPKNRPDTALRTNTIPIDVERPTLDPSTGAVVPVDRLVVNHEVVHAAELWDEAREEAIEKRKLLSPSEYESWLNQRAAQLIKDRVAEMLLYQAAAARLDPAVQKNVDRYVDQEIRKIVTDRHGGVQGNYERELARRGRTLDDERKRLRREVIISAHLDQEVRPRMGEPTRAELLSHFEKNRDSWRRPPRRSMSLIHTRILDRLPREVSTPTKEQTEAAREEARSRIHAALLELKNGASFPDVARAYGDDARAADGGAWGWISPEAVTDRYRPAVDALSHLKEGEISDIIETPDGFFIVRCDQLDPGFEPTFENMQPEITKSFNQFAFNTLVGELVESLARRATIQPANLASFHAAVVAAAPKP